jgi:NAD/NADP transhydrogenase alpha subunit
MNPRENPDNCSPMFKDIVLRAQHNEINLLSMGHLPRISRAQKSDAISTFGKLAGHRACVEAAAAFGQIMSGEITSAGNNPQAKAWVGGCGVAGLEAVAILKKMGCEVYATDVRDIEDQIISVGGKFVHYDPEGLKRAKDSGGYAPTFGQEMQDQQDRMYNEWSKKCNVMILTAAIPGMPPPRLLSKAMVDRMEPGSVIVDIAANKFWGAKYNRALQQGSLWYTGREATPWPGNCEYTRPGELFITPNGVKVVGYTDLPSRFGKQATNFYANNLVNLLEDMCAKGTVAERGMKEPELGTAQDFKIDMHVVRSQTNDHPSFATGEFAIGDDIMAGMCLVKVENGQAMLDYPKKRKPMETAQAIFEKEIKSQGASLVSMEQKLVTLKEQAGNSSRNLMDKYATEDVSAVHHIVLSRTSSHQKIEASLQFEETKKHNDMVKWMSGMIKAKKQDIRRADKEARLATLEAGGGGDGDGMLTKIVIGCLAIGSCFAMGFVPFPEHFIGSAMIFVLASVLGYCLCANVKPSLHTPLMSMSNAISGIVIIGGMYQIQGDFLWGGAGLMDQMKLEYAKHADINTFSHISQTELDGGMLDGGMTATQLLGSIAVAVSAINIAGGFAVTFRMLEMFKASPTNGSGADAYMDMDIGQRTPSWLRSFWPVDSPRPRPLPRQLSGPLPRRTAGVFRALVGLGRVVDPRNLWRGP